METREELIEKVLRTVDEFTCKCGYSYHYDNIEDKDNIYIYNNEYEYGRVWIDHNEHLGGQDKDFHPKYNKENLNPLNDVNPNRILIANDSNSVTLFSNYDISCGLEYYIEKIPNVNLPENNLFKALVVVIGLNGRTLPEVFGES